MSSLIFIYLTNGYLGSRSLYFFSRPQGSTTDSGVGRAHGGRWPAEVGSHLEGFKGKGEHRPSETLVIIYSWDADVPEK